MAGSTLEALGMIECKGFVALVEACDDADGQLADHTHRLNELMDFYVSSLRRVDQLQRECEQAVGDHLAVKQRDLPCGTAERQAADLKPDAGCFA